MINILNYVKAPLLTAVMCLMPAVSLAQSPLSTAVTSTDLMTGAYSHRRLSSLPPSGPQDAQNPVDLLSSLPPSDLVVMIELNRITKEFIPRLLAHQPDVLASVNTAFAFVHGLIGLDPQASNRAVVGVRYQKPSSGTNKSEWGMVLVTRGNTKSWLLPAFIKSLGGDQYREQQYGGTTLYSVRMMEEAKEKVGGGMPLPAGDVELVVAALDENTIAIGTLTEVRSCIDLRAGRGAHVSDDLLAAVRRNPAALISVAGVVPPSLFTDSAPGTKGDQDKLDKALSLVKQFTLSLEPKGKGMEMSAAAMAGNAEQAQTMSEILSARIAQARAGMLKNEQDQLAHEFLSTLGFSTRGAEVLMKAELSPAMVEKQIKGMVAEYHNYTGMTRLNEGDFAEALTHFEKAIALAPEREVYYSNRGVARYRQGEADGAMADLNKALTLDPNLAIAYTLRGVLRLHKGDTAGAMADQNKAIALNPNLAEAYSERGLLHLQQENPKEALVDLNKAIALT